MASGLELAQDQFKRPAERGANGLPGGIQELYSTHPVSRIPNNLLNIRGLRFSTRHTWAIGAFALFFGSLRSLRFMGRKPQTADLLRIYSQHPEIEILANLRNIHGLYFSNRNTSPFAAMLRFFDCAPCSHVAGHGSRLAQIVLR